MELEGVLGRKEYLLDLIKALEPTGGAENALQSRETKCIIIFLNISRIGWFGERTFRGNTTVITKPSYNGGQKLSRSSEKI